jgi:hypothetical protein
VLVRRKGAFRRSGGGFLHTRQPFARTADTICYMQDAQQTLDHYFLEMRWRCLSLAADLDRVERAPGGSAVIGSDPRLKKLRDALGVLLESGPNRAEQVQNIFSDKTPPPGRG